MKIVLASHNKKKLAEMQTLLAACCPNAELVLPSDVGIREEPEETGATFLENALIKARFISRCGYIAVADDSGLCVDALHGEPGVRSARFSGGGDDENNALLLKKLDRTPQSRRGAHFTCCMVCTLPGEERYLAVQEICRGRILEAPEGDDGFGYDPLFFSDELQKSFGAASAVEKNGVSHRGRAARRFAASLGDFIGHEHE